MEIAFTPVLIAAVVGTLMTLFFAYCPWVRVWFASLRVEQASYIKLGLMLVAEVALSLLSYYDIIVTKPPFSWETAVAVAVALILSNQPISAILPTTADVRAALRKANK